MYKKYARIFIIFLAVLFIHVEPSFSQKKKNNIKLVKLLEELSKKHKVFFTYNSTLLQGKFINAALFKNTSLEESLSIIEKKTSYSFDDLGNNYFVMYSDQKTKQPSLSPKKQQVLTRPLELSLNEVLITGNRAKPRTILNSPVPVDNFNIKELRNSGKITLDRMLTFTVPSFNSQNQAISDATAHYDPSDIRALGPSRMLVLINGKRKNKSAQVYLNRTPGKGEVGIDLNSIPIAAIERIEVLRDGASAQYGSDAIAGVLNIILKKNAPNTTFNAITGITSQGDGLNYSIDFNRSFNLKNKGVINLTLSYFNQKHTNRAGTPGISDLPDTPLDHWVSWAQENSDLGMIVGQPNMIKKDLFVNLEQPIGQNKTLYSFHGFNLKNGKSFAYYRAPYWRQDNVGNSGFLSDPDEFIGYRPTFESKIKDFTNVLGVNFQVKNDLKADISITHGLNSIEYTVDNSVNIDYLLDHGSSPRLFKPGGYMLRNLIGNLDFNGILSKKISFASGIEYKKEFFTSTQGDPFSYYKRGSDSFAGIKPSEAGTWSRSNIAGYAQLDYDTSKNFLVGFAGRYEHFSDFGSNFSWKISSRYKLGDQGVLRASYNTGFRAPSLHQRYLTNSQYIPVGNSPTPLLQRTLANDVISAELGVSGLFAETSENLSAGITYKFNSKFSASLDFYQIKIHDRVLFSSQIASIDGVLDGSDSVEQILIDNNVNAMQFFINAGDTRTTGADIIVNYKNIPLGKGKLNFSFASNINETTFKSVKTPQKLAENGYNIFDRQERGLITNSRPKSKILLGINYNCDKWDVLLNNTRFGQVTITAPESGGIDQDLSSKIATDIGFIYKFSKHIQLHTSLNNIFDVYPDKTLRSTNTNQAANRFMYSSEVQQLGQLGANFNFGINYTF